MCASVSWWGEPHGDEEHVHRDLQLSPALRVALQGPSLQTAGHQQHRLWALLHRHHVPHLLSAGQRNEESWRFTGALQESEEIRPYFHRGVGGHIAHHPRLGGSGFIRVDFNRLKQESPTRVKTEESSP